MEHPEEPHSPEKWWTTPYMRTLHDFGWISGRETGFFGNLETISGLTIERRRLAKQLDLYSALSFLGGALILSGGFPQGMEISLFGIAGPGQLISLPLLSVLVSAVFMRCWHTLISVTILTQMIDMILSSLVGAVHIDFVTARFDASLLWTNILRKRNIGFQSPAAHIVTAAIIPISGILMLVLHASIVLYALWSSLLITVRSESGFFMTTITILAFCMSLSAIVIYFVGLMVPLPFRMSADMRSFLAQENARQAANGGAATVR